MGARIRKTSGIIVLVFIICMISASCGLIRRPAYVLIAGENDDIVESYKAYFEVDNYTVRDIKEDRYKNLILKTKDEYMLIEQNTYTFSTKAKSSNVSKWTIKENIEDENDYDIEKLKKYLGKMNNEFWGDINIQLAEFDDYTVIEIQNFENDEITGISTALFKNGQLIALPEGVTLKSLKYVYKLI